MPLTLAPARRLHEQIAELERRRDELRAQRDRAREQRDAYRAERDALRAIRETAAMRLVGGELNVERPRYFVAERAGLAYLRVPKAACSTIRGVLLYFNDPQLYEEKFDQFAGDVRAFHHADGVAEETDDPGDCLRFTVVRHPFDRFLSWYHNLMVDLAPGGKRELTDSAVLAETNARLGDFGFRIGMSFEDYCEAVFSRPHSKQNPHVRRQVDLLLGAGELAVDFIGRLENLERDLGRLTAGLGKGAPPVRSINPSSNKGWRKSDLLTPVVLEKLREFYEQDLRFLGYPS